MKKILFILMTLVMSVSAFAQNNVSYSNYDGQSKFTDNWSVGLEGGIQTNLHDWNNPNGAVWGINLNKDFTPTFGVSVEALTGINNAANGLYNFDFKHISFDNLDVFLTGRWNVLNTICGFKGNRRFFEIETNAGVGYGRNFDAETNALLVKAGLNFKFNLGKERAWSILVKPAVIWNVSEPGQFDSRVAVGQLTAGVTYNFKTSNGTHYFAATPVPYLVSENAALNDVVNQLRAELEDARKNVREIVVEHNTETVVTNYVEKTYVVNFAQNKSELTEAAKAVLDKVPANATVEVAATASPEGTAKYNVGLSVRRANAVADYLKARGVNVVSAVGFGATDEASNRIAVVTVR